MAGKIQEFRGSAASDVTSGYITSPNFPLGYARQGEKYLYYIHNTDVNGTIRLIFEDWDIGQNTRLLVSKGEFCRKCIFFPMELQ